MLNYRAAPAAEILVAKLTLRPSKEVRVIKVNYMHPSLSINQNIARMKINMQKAVLNEHSHLARDLMYKRLGAMQFKDLRIGKPRVLGDLPHEEPPFVPKQASGCIGYWLGRNHTKCSHLIEQLKFSLRASPS